MAEEKEGTEVVVEPTETPVEPVAPVEPTAKKAPKVEPRDVDLSGLTEKLKRAEERAEWRAIRERGTQLASLQGLRRSRMRASLREMSKVVTKLERTGQIRSPDAPPPNFIKPPRLSVVRPRKIRSDFGKRHRFRGRPGFPLRPEDLQYEN